jgi:hypothetical protein
MRQANPKATDIQIAKSVAAIFKAPERESVARDQRNDPDYGRKKRAAKPSVAAKSRSRRPRSPKAE